MAGDTRGPVLPLSPPYLTRGSLSPAPTPRDQAGREPISPGSGGTTSPPSPKAARLGGGFSRAGCSPPRQEAAAARAGRARDRAIQRQHPRGRTPTDLVEAALGREDGDVAVEAGAGASGHGGSGEGRRGRGAHSVQGPTATADRAPAGALPGHAPRAGAATPTARAPSRSPAATAHARARRRGSRTAPAAPLPSMRTRAAGRGARTLAAQAPPLAGRLRAVVSRHVTDVVRGVRPLAARRL